MKNKYKFTCEFCGKHFVREYNYLKHTCEPMRRTAMLETTIGQAAWEFYKNWLSKNRRNPRNADSFISSQFYKPFIRFAEFVKKMSIPEPDKYIWLMVERKYRPNVWTEDVVYRKYLEFVDVQGDPYDRAAFTVRALQRIASEHDCELCDVHKYITAPELVHRIYIRELSPWIILTSTKFLSLIRNSDPAEQVMLENVIRPDFWKERFKKNPTAYNDLKNIVKRFKL